MWLWHCSRFVCFYQQIWSETEKWRDCTSKNKLCLHLTRKENLKPVCNSCWDFMCTDTHIKHHHTPSHSVHVRVNYVRCVSEVSDNLSKTHAVLLRCTLRSAVLPLIYSFAPLCASRFFICAAAKLCSYFSFFFYQPPPLLFLSLSLGLQGLDGKSTSICCTVPLSSWLQSILKGFSVSQFLLCSCHQ